MVYKLWNADNNRKILSSNSIEKCKQTLTETLQNRVKPPPAVLRARFTMVGIGPTYRYILSSDKWNVIYGHL